MYIDYIPTKVNLHLNGDCAGQCDLCDSEDERLEHDHRNGEHDVADPNCELCESGDDDDDMICWTSANE